MKNQLWTAIATTTATTNEWWRWIHELQIMMIRSDERWTNLNQLLCWCLFDIFLLLLLLLLQIVLLYRCARLLLSSLPLFFFFEQPPPTTFMGALLQLSWVQFVCCYYGRLFDLIRLDGWVTYRRLPVDCIENAS